MSTEPTTSEQKVEHHLLELARSRRAKADAGGTPNYIGAHRAAQGAFEIAADLVREAALSQPAQEPPDSGFTSKHYGSGKKTAPVPCEVGQDDVERLREKLLSGEVLDEILGEGAPGFVRDRLRGKIDAALNDLAPAPDVERLGGEEGPGAAEMLAEFHALFSYEKTTDPALRLTLHEEEHKELVEAIESGDLEAIARELADVVYVAYGSAWSLGIDLDAAIREVHRANLSKLGDDGKPVYRDDGKVLKGPNFRPPDLRLALEGHPVVIDQERGGIFLADANPSPVPEHSKEETPRCNCGRNVEGDWHEAGCPLSRQPNQAAPEHSKGGLEDGGWGWLRAMKDWCAEEAAKASGEKRAAFQRVEQRLAFLTTGPPTQGDIAWAKSVMADHASPQPNQGSDQPKDCGGSGRLLVEPEPGFDTKEAEYTPCPGCNHTDCPNRDQAKASRCDCRPGLDGGGFHHEPDCASFDQPKEERR